MTHDSIARRDLLTGAAKSVAVVAVAGSPGGEGADRTTSTHAFAGLDARAAAGTGCAHEDDRRLR